jgi:transketolase
MAYTETDLLAVQTIRTLSIDAIEAANSGHPGLPMGAAPMAYVLWSRFLQHNPDNPDWFNRDRFILSAGHGSMLLYSLLHLSGYDVSIDDLKKFRQYGSKTPGHPEYGHTPGVDTTTGPLGQGIATAVGMAMAERFLAAKFNRDGHEVVDHYTYALVGDGDLMEGISAEASSLAGHLKLNRLIVLYDSNGISLDGPTSWSFTEDVAARYRAYGWNVMHVADGNNLEEIEAAIRAAHHAEAPTLIEVKTIIGYGAPTKQGTAKVHGSPLGTEEALKAKAFYAWEHEDLFYVPGEVRQLFAQLKSAGQQKEISWNAMLADYRQSHGELWDQLETARMGKVHLDFEQVVPEFSGGVATRDAFGTIINAVAPHIPTLVGGSADLSGSNKTLLDGVPHFGPDNYGGANVFYGVREHAMGAILNGLTLHHGIFAYAGTFLVFCDYLRPSIRLAALMKQPVLYVFTHDSIAVGEDGPTHEPIEQLASLRAIPHLRVFRPADATETAYAVEFALTHREAPVALALTRQKLPTLEEVKGRKSDFGKGAYVLFQQGKGLELILLASGSEVHLALEAAKQLAVDGVEVRMVNVPSMEVFDAMDPSYRESVLPSHAQHRLALEMAHPMPWYKYVGLHGDVIAIDRFGASGPGDVVMREYGFTLDHVVERARTLISANR